MSEAAHRPAKLSFHGITKRYGRVAAVTDATLEIRRGEFVSLLGGSGCGKTTLLRILAGFTRPDAGRVLIDGRPVDHLAPRARGLGFVFQSYALFPTQTVAQNIGFSLSLRGAPRAEVARRVAELCALVQIEGLEQRYPHELSGGQQQRVALARALAPRPEIMLMDEPLSALDAKIRAHLRAEIRAIVERLGVTTVYVTHDQEEALALSDRVAVMDRGVIRQVGSSMEIYLQPVDRFVAGFVGTTNAFPVEPAGAAAIRLDEVVIPVGTLPAGGALQLCVRPEHIDLAAATDAAHPLAARLLGFAFMGQMVRATLATPAGREFLVDCWAADWLAKGLAPGAAVAWGLRPGKAMVFPDEGG